MTKNMLSDKSTSQFLRSKSMTMGELQNSPDRFFSVWLSLSNQVYKYCFFKLRLNHWDAEDLVSETMLKAYSKFPSANPESNMQGWLTLLARNIYFDQIRKIQLQSKYIQSNQDTEDFNKDELFNHNSNLRTLNKIKNKINKLNSKNRKIAFDYFFKEHSYQEISAEHSISAQKIRKIIHRSRIKIKQHLETT